MNTEISQNESLFYRTLLALGMILLAAALRIAPHPWNFTPVGAMALFSGAVLRDRRLAFLFPLLTLFLGDIFIGFHKLVPIVYASFLLSVLIGRLLQNRRTILRIGAATLLGSAQFFLVTNFAVWWLLNSYPKISRRRSVLLEHPCRRRLLLRASIRRLRASRTFYPCAASVRRTRVRLMNMEWRVFRPALFLCQQGATVPLLGYPRVASNCAR